MPASLKFALFMASPTGRALRMAAGFVLIAAGLGIGGAAGVIVGVVGLVPLGAGMFDICTVAPLMGLPLRGRDVRALAERRSAEGGELPRPT